MADIILIGDVGDCSEESDENTFNTESRSLETTSSSSQDVFENINEIPSDCSKDCSGMTLKQELDEPDLMISELFAADDIPVNPDDLLPPVVKLEKYVNSEIIFNRQVVCRNLLETLRLVHKNADDVARVAAVVSTISRDRDPTVRSELMIHVADIAAFCKDVKLDDFIVQHLVPILIAYIEDDNNLVRKFTHSCIVSCVEQELLDRGVEQNIVAEKICPIMLNLIDNVHSEELRIESLSVIIKLMSFAGKQTVEEMFFDPFFALCADKSNNIRKACASVFGDLATTVGEDVTEKRLLPVFFQLCIEDNAWGVRKACAENFTPISYVVSKQTRFHELADMYMVLLSDQSRWVRLTAYQALGPFISTFADPERTGLYYSKDGVLTFVQRLVPAEKCSETACNGEDGDDSSLERTSSMPCDSVVPESSSTETHSSEENTCHDSSYCTVIEVSSPTKNPLPPTMVVDEANADVTTNSDSIYCDFVPSFPYSGDSWTSNDPSNSENGICSNTSRSSSGDQGATTLEKIDWGWGELLYNDTSDVVNGALVNGVHEESDELEDLSKSDEKSAILNAITVNGFNINSSVLLSGPINGETIPVITCSNSKKFFLLEKEKRRESQNSFDSLNGFESISESIENDGIPDSDSKEPDKTLELKNNQLNSEITTARDESSAFNQFQYWREPLPDLEAVYVDDILSEDDHDSIVNPYLFVRDKEVKRRQKYGFFGKNSSNKPLRLNMKPISPGRCAPFLFEKGEPPPGATASAHDQDIVPPELLLQYLSMIDAAWAQTIDAEIARHCAYSLPAVALTLGREFWPCLKDTFDALCSDLQSFIMMWKVRRTVASAMHQLAVILGPEITARDLVPVYQRFISDLDEVRIGVLQHLYEFVKELRPLERVELLPSFPEFLVSNSDTDSNEKNWRFRLIFAEQLVLVADLYEPREVRDNLVPLAFALIKDKVCEVRLAAVRVMAAMMKNLCQSTDIGHSKFVLSELTEKFVHSPKWLHRQIFVYICQQFILEMALSADQFAEDALPQLLYLCWDRVPNVRIAIARCLVVVIWPMDVFSSPDSPHRELLLQTIHTLQSDLDADVRFYANMVSTHECSCLHNGEFTNSIEPF